MVSVFTPTIGREMIARAAASLLAQTHGEWQWIVLDVGSEPIRHLLPEDERIDYCREPPAQGPARDFQRVLDLCTGEVVHPLSDDDALTPPALEIAASEIAGHQWLVGMTNLYDASGVLWTTRGGTQESFAQTMAGDYMLGGAVYWRRELTERLGGFNPDYSGAADVDLYMRFGRDSQPRIIPDVLYCYHDHPQTDSNLHGREQGRQVRRIVQNS